MIVPSCLRHWACGKKQFCHWVRCFLSPLRVQNYLYSPASFGWGVGELDFSSIWGNLVKSCNLFWFCFPHMRIKLPPITTSRTSLKNKFRWCERQKNELGGFGLWKPGMIITLFHCPVSWYFWRLVQGLGLGEGHHLFMALNLSTEV